MERNGTNQSMLLVCTLVVLLMATYFLFAVHRKPEARQEKRIGKRGVVYDCSIGDRVWCESNRQCKTMCTPNSRVYCDTTINRCTTIRQISEAAVDTLDDSDCAEHRGLIKVLDRTNRWKCANYTSYTDQNGESIGGNCGGPDRVISYYADLQCGCPATEDSVTGKRYHSAQLNINGLQMCVLNKQLYEVD